MLRLTSQLNKAKCPPELINLILSLSVACKEISFRLQQGSVDGLLGSAGNENVQGEEQKKLDVISNEVIKTYLQDCGVVRALASEEEEDIVPCSPDGRYLVAFDPLDGSSNIDINSLVGTIFSIYQAPQGKTDISAQDFLIPGRQQVAAGYVLYGPSVMLVLSTGQGVKMFTLDHRIGVFILARDNVRISVNTREFAINMSNQRHWAEPMQHYVRDLLAGSEGPRGKNFNMRWVAAMVGDIHRLLSRGGIFSYPWDRREPDKAGKLRLLYEANPMGFLVEQAGGRACTESADILDLQPQHIHQRVPVIMGSTQEVETCLRYHEHD